MTKIDYFLPLWSLYASKENIYNNMIDIFNNWVSESNSKAQRGSLSPRDGRHWSEKGRCGEQI